MGQSSQMGHKGNVGEEEEGGKEKRSDGGRVRLAFLPPGSAALQWHLTGKGSNTLNRTHGGLQVCVSVCA